MIFQRKKRTVYPNQFYQELESRNLLAGITFDNGALSIVGSDTVDDIAITELSDGQTEVTVNDLQPELFASQSLTSIRILSRGGDDSVEITQDSNFQTQLLNLQTLFISTGDGNDLSVVGIPDFTAEITAIGGAGNDRLAAHRLFSIENPVAVTNSVSFFGGDGDDVISGAGGNDRLSGQSGNDRIFGGSGDDTLVGGSGDDILDGEDGSDRLLGQGGDDSLRASGFRFPNPVDSNEFLSGGDGNDFLMGSSSGDLIIGGAGRDRINGEGGDDTIFGGDDRDEIQGGDGNDLIAGQGGNDLIRGQNGQDRLFGNQGLDEIHGGFAADQIFGGTERDTIFGDEGDDIIHAGTGNDFVQGGIGVDRIAGHDGDDFINGGVGDDLIFGGSGNDALVGYLGADLLAGQAGDDNLLGQQGSDVIIGGSGDDRIEGGRDLDRLVGNNGVDIFVFPESDTIADFDAATETQTSIPYPDRYLGLTLDDAVALAQNFNQTVLADLPDVSFSTNQEGIVISALNQSNGGFARLPALTDYIGLTASEVIETAAGYGIDFETFDISAGESYSVIEPVNPPRLLIANDRVLAIDGPRGAGFFNMIRLNVQPLDDAYLGLNFSEASILAEANGFVAVATSIDGVRTGESTLQSSRLSLSFNDGIVTRVGSSLIGISIEDI